VDDVVSKTNLQTVSVQCFTVRAPGHRLPQMVRCAFVSERRYLASTPIHQLNVIHGSFFWLGVEGDCLPVGRPARALFANLRSIGQVDYFTTVTRDSKDVPQF